MPVYTLPLFPITSPSFVQLHRPITKDQHPLAYPQTYYSLQKLEYSYFLSLLSAYDMCFSFLRSNYYIILSPHSFLSHSTHSLLYLGLDDCVSVREDRLTHTIESFIISSSAHHSLVGASHSLICWLHSCPPQSHSYSYVFIGCTGSVSAEVLSKDLTCFLSGMMDEYTHSLVFIIKQSIISWITHVLLAQRCVAISSNVSSYH